MKRTKYLQKAITIFCATVFALAPSPAVALDFGHEAGAGPVIITEVQTGGSTAGEEFVELYNNSDTPVDITGWQVRYLNAGGAPTATTLLATIVGVEGASVTLGARGHFVLHTASVTIPTGVAGQQYDAALSKTDKTVALYAREALTCQLLVQDAIAWEAVPETTLGEGTAVTVPSAQVNKEKLLQRQMLDSDEYADTNNNAQDVVLVGPTPGAPNAPANGGLGGLSPLPPLAAPDCTPPVDPPVEPPIEPPADPPAEPPTNPENPPAEPEDPPQEPPAEEPPVEQPPTEEPPAEQPPVTPAEPPLITELLPNPGVPLTDASDEYIELHNPASVPFDLGGYVLEAGITTKYRYTFPTGTTLESGAYRAFFSADTGIALSNTTSQVRLISPEGVTVRQTDAYSTAADNTAWAFIDGSWQWTTSLTPNAANPSTPPPAEPEDPEPPAQDPAEPVPDPESPPPPPVNDGLLAPQLTELLPNPAAPLTDAEDEFIELYNPNDAPFILDGYILEVGTTTKRRYTFPAGTVLPPHTYAAFFSADTSLALSNTGGQTRLLSPDGAALSETQAYSKANDGLAWVLMGGGWQWSTTPTPFAGNAFTAIIAATTAKAKAKTTAAKKPAATKTSNAKTKAAQTSNDDHSALSAAAPRDPLHPGVLAGVASFAVLYGAYEYRRDLANKLHQFRSYRAARAAARHGAQGR